MDTAQVVEFAGQPSALSFQQPAQYINETQKYENGARWFYDNLLYCASFYNRIPRNITIPGYTEATTVYEQPVNQMLINMLYYLGRQPQFTYAYMAQNVDGKNYQPIFRKGQDLLPLIENMRGNIERILNAFHFSVKPLSAKARSARSDYFNNIMLEYLTSQYGMNVQGGAQFNPSGLSDIGRFEQHQIETYVEKNYKDYACELMVNIAQGGHTTESIDLYTRAFLYGQICGWVGLEHYVDNGRHFKFLHLPYQMIVDTRIDDNMNRSARFAGVITSMTPTEIFHRYPYLSHAQRLEIQNIARSTELFGKYNATYTNFQWWTPNANNADATASVVRTYWISPQFLDARAVKNPYGVAQLLGSKVEWDREQNTLRLGDNTYENVDADSVGKYLNQEDAHTLVNLKSEKPTVTMDSSTYVVNSVYKATVIGNRYMVDFGMSTNVVEHPLMKYKPLLPIQIWTPNMIGGETRSTVDRLRGIQDEIDAMRQIRREMLGRAKGKVVGIYPWRFGGADNVKEFVEDAHQMGAHVFSHSGEVDPQEIGKSPVETIDMTLDPGYEKVEGGILALKTEQKEIISTSTAALGQITTYIGSDTLQNSVAQSTLGQSSLLNGYISWITVNHQYELDVKKTLYVLNPKSFDAEIVVGDQGTEFFRRILPDLKFEDFLLYINVRDVIDQEQRERVISYGQAYMQNIGNPQATRALRNVLRLEKTKTFTEALSDLEKDIVIEDKMQAAEKEQAMMQEKQLMAAEQQAEELKQIRQFQADIIGKLTEIQEKGQWNIATELVKAGVQPPQPSSPTEKSQEVIAPLMQQQQPQQSADLAGR